MLKPRDAQSVPSLMLKRELESVRRELRSLKRGQHENMQEDARRRNDSSRKDDSREKGHAVYDSRCETCLKAVQDAVSDAHCDCVTEALETSQDLRNQHREQPARCSDNKSTKSSCRSRML